MKKPNIEVRPAPRFEQMGDHFWLNGKVLTLGQIETRYTEMLDALIMCREILQKLNRQSGGTLLDNEEIYKIDNALIKAGCTDE